MPKICYLILSTQKSIARQVKMKETWLLGKDYYFLSDEDDPENRVLLMSRNNDYKSAEEKFMNGLNYAKRKARTGDFEWFVLCDDDSFILEKNLKKVLGHLPHDKFCGKVLSPQRDPQNPIWFRIDYDYLSGGAGMVVHADCLKPLPDFVNYNTGWSDVGLGLNLRNSKTEAFHVDGFNSTNLEELQFEQDLASQQISFHFIKQPEQVDRLCDLEASIRVSSVDEAYQSLFGHLSDVQSLGWGSSVSQKKRFDILLEIRGRNSQDSVLDMGCGYGDMSPRCENYLGVDCRHSAIEMARQKYPESRFLCGSIDDVEDEFDWIVASGLFCLKENWESNTENLLKRMFEICKKGIACNFLSDLTRGKKNPHMKYATVSDVVQIVSKITNNFEVRHDYLANDLSLYIYREPL